VETTAIPPPCAVRVASKRWRLALKTDKSNEGSIGVMIHILQSLSED
jgi:hypothetical protein